MALVMLIFHHDISQLFLEILKKVSATNNSISVLYVIEALFNNHR